jgi:nucleoside phosphorylase
MPTPSVPGSVDLLVLAAYAPELAGMRRSLGEQLYGNISGVVVSCKAVGVGLPNATAGTILRLQQLRPRAVVLVGTCGYYPGTANPPAIGDVVVGRRVVLVDPIEVEHRGAIPEPIARATECSAVLAFGLAGGRAPTVDVANTLGVTTDDALAALLGSAGGCGVENLEAFGIANACALQGVSFATVLGVSNRVGSTGREEWRSYHKPAAQAACEVVNRWLAAGAVGLPHV